MSSASVHSSTSSVFTALTDASNPPTTGVAVVDSTVATAQVEVFFLVLPGNFYKVTSSAGTPVTDLWTEWT